MENIFDKIMVRKMNKKIIKFRSQSFHKCFNHIFRPKSEISQWSSLKIHLIGQNLLKFKKGMSLSRSADHLLTLMLKTEEYNPLHTQKSATSGTPLMVSSTQDSDCVQPVSYTHLDVYKRQI